MIIFLYLMICGGVIFWPNFNAIQKASYLIALVVLPILLLLLG